MTEDQYRGFARDARNFAGHEFVEDEIAHYADGLAGKLATMSSRRVRSTVGSDLTSDKLAAPGEGLGGVECLRFLRALVRQAPSSIRSQWLGRKITQVGRETV